MTSDASEGRIFFTSTLTETFSIFFDVFLMVLSGNDFFSVSVVKDFNSLVSAKTSHPRNQMVCALFFFSDHYTDLVLLPDTCQSSVIYRHLIG